MGFRKGERWKKLIDIQQDDVRKPTIDKLFQALGTAKIPVQTTSNRMNSDWAERWFIPDSRYQEASAILNRLLAEDSHAD